MGKKHKNKHANQTKAASNGEEMSTEEASELNTSQGSEE
jgi:hypothetical protein